MRGLTGSSVWEPGTLLPSLRGQALARRDPFRAPVVIRQKVPTSSARFTYEHPDLDDDPQEDPFVMRDTSLAGRIAEEIERVYPWPTCLIFDVRIETQQGLIQIRLKGLMARHSYNCHVAAVETDPKCAQVLTGCGELLERYGLPRVRLDGDDIRAARAARPLWMRPADEVPGGSYAKRW